MPLRSHAFLDSEPLFAQAEYYDIQVPRAAQIVEQSHSCRSGGAKIGLPADRLDAEAGGDIEIQSTYPLGPREKAAVNKEVDALIVADLAKRANPETVEREGTTRITTASLAGKLFHIVRKAMGEAPVGTSGEVNDWMARLNFDAAAPFHLRDTSQRYLNGKLVPVLILLGDRWQRAAAEGR